MSNLVKQENNNINNGSLQQQLYQTYEAINNGLLRISNDVITIITSHGLCIIEDKKSVEVQW